MGKRLLTALLFVVVMFTFSMAQENKRINVSGVYSEEDQYEDDPYYWSYSKEIGINFTPLISKLVPFNLGENEAGNVGLIWKKYYSTRAFRMKLGANISANFSTVGKNFIFLSLGLEKRYPITNDKKIAYTSSWDLFAQASDNFDSDLYGVAKGYGFEYHITKRIFISTEAQFNIGLGSESEGPVIEFKLPTAIFVNIRLY